LTHHAPTETKGTLKTAVDEYRLGILGWLMDDERPANTLAELRNQLEQASLNPLRSVQFEHEWRSKYGGSTRPAS
jgi:hypothetical protein